MGKHFEVFFHRSYAMKHREVVLVYLYVVWYWPYGGAHPPIAIWIENVPKRSRGLIDSSGPTFPLAAGRLQGEECVEV